MVPRSIAGRLWVGCIVAVLAFGAAAAAAAGADAVAEALAEVRDLKADLHSRQSSVLGQLAGPEEMAAQQMRCRPAPVPRAGVERDIDFDQATIQRAAKVSPAALAKAAPRFGGGILPLGITGAYFKESLNKVELLVVHVLPDSPAGKALQVGDVIIGANGRLFVDKEDPRPEMGNALCESQSPALGGILTLHVVRDKKPINVKIDLGSTLGYSDTWPYNCQKTRQIRQAALQYVMNTHPWDRRDFWTPTFLMASGDDAALELARRELLAGLQDKYPEGHGCSTWSTSYKLINLCEYYLLTGDSSVLPAITYETQNIAWAQYRSGSWSHGGGGDKVSGPGQVAGGYGEINCAGLGAFIGLCLARQCGIEPYAHTLPRSIRFFGKFCGTNFPYGLGNPGFRGGRMDNGMNSMAAIGFHLLGADDMADRWARTVCYMWMGRERGHAEAMFSGAWGPVGAALAPRPEFHAFMSNMKWSYELCRARDGSLTFMRGGRWEGGNMTAAMGLFLFLPEHRLQILGGDSVFAHKPPKALADAAYWYRTKQWDRLRTFLTGYIKARKGTPAELEYARKLLAAYNRLEGHAAATLKIIARSIADGRFATAKLQLDLLARMLGAERPEAAALRKRLADGKDSRRKPLEPLIDKKQIAKDLSLNTRGPDNGFACSPAYIRATNAHGFEGMAPEQIARFFNCPSGSLIDGAVAALAARGEKILPLLKRMLTDTHPGVRAGALSVLADMYRFEGEEYRTEVPDELREIIDLARPMTRDAHPLVRNAATGLLLSMKIVNDDVCQVLREMAKVEDAKIDHVVRYGIKDPKLRVELAMELINTNNRTKSQVPADYKPMNWAVGAHLDECGPSLQTAIDTLNNPAVVLLYGFFSQGPPNMSMEMLFHYSDNPLVLKNLDAVLRFGVRRRGGVNRYWMPCTEYPHRIVIRLGPQAIPAVKAFCASERALYKRIEAGQQERPAWYKDDAPEFLESWIADMQVTTEMVKCLYGLKPIEQAAPALCSMYLANRPWGAWERQQIRDHFTKLGLQAIPYLRQATAATAGTPRAELAEQIAAKRAEVEAAGKSRDKARRQEELDALLYAASRYDELVELAGVIVALHAETPDDAAVRTLCRFYVKRPWGKAYPYTENDTSYIRPFDETQLALIREKFMQWGRAALPAVRAFLAADAADLAKALAQLDTDQRYWEQQRARLRGQPLARIERERQDIQEIRAELADIAFLMGAAGAKRLSAEQLARLCEIHTHRHWPAQSQGILEMLRAAGPAAAPILRKQIDAARQRLSDLQATIDHDMTKPASTATKWRYDRAVALKKNLLAGIEELQAIAGQGK